MMARRAVDLDKPCVVTYKKKEFNLNIRKKDLFYGLGGGSLRSLGSLNPVPFMSLFGHALFNYNPPKHSRKVW